MRPFEERLRSVLREWLVKADMDYRAPIALSRSRDLLREAIAFHCQQAVEKYVKAVLVFRQVECQKTHDIDALLDLVATFDSELATALADARSLTAYAVQVRYPGDSPEVLPGREIELLDIAERTRKLVLDRLGES